MRASEVTHDRSRDDQIIAPQPLAQLPVDLKQPLPVSRTRVCVGLFLLISSFALGVGSAFFAAAQLWLFAACALLSVCSFWVLGLHRLRAHAGGRDPRKLYGHQTHLTHR